MRDFATNTKRIIDVSSEQVAFTAGQTAKVAGILTSNFNTGGTIVVQASDADDNILFNITVRGNFSSVKEDTMQVPFLVDNGLKFNTFSGNGAFAHMIIYYMEDA